MSVTLYLGHKVDGRWHIVEGTDEFQYNLANGNFARVMNLCGFEAWDYCGIWETPQELRDAHDKLAFVMDSIRAMPDLDGGIPNVVHDEPGKMKLIQCGVPDGYFEMRIKQFMTVIAEALRRGCSVYWA